MVRQRIDVRVAAAVTTLTASLAFAMPASAADLGGNCCADLEERIAELEATTSRKGNRISSLTVSGQVGGQQRVVVLDPTSFAIEDDALRFIATNITDILDSTLDGTNTVAPFAPSNQMNLGAGRADSASNGSADSPPLANSGVWASGFGGRASLDSDNLSEADQSFGGGIGGGHFRFAPGLAAGAFAGGATNTLQTERGKTIDSSYVLGGIYGRAVSGQMFLDASVTGGRSNSESDRQFVTTDPAVPPAQTAHADYDGSFFLPVLRGGAYLPIGNGIVLVPAAQVRYNWQHLDGYTERGSSVNLGVGDRTLQSFEERLELGIRTSLGLSSGSLLALHANIGAVFYQRTGDRTVDFTVFGTSASRGPGGPDNETGIFGGAGFDLRMTSNVSLFGNVEGLRTQDAESVSGMGGVRVNF